MVSVIGVRRVEHWTHEAEFAEHAKLAVWLGHEASSLSDLAVEQGHMCNNISMSVMIESLNLATSSGIVRLG